MNRRQSSRPQGTQRSRRPPPAKAAPARDAERPAQQQVLAQPAQASAAGMAGLQHAAGN